MRKAVVGLLVSQLALPWAVPRAWSGDDPALGVAAPAAQEVKATLVTVDAAAKNLSYVEEPTGRLRAASLSDAAIAQAVQLKSGQKVTLHTRVTSPSGEPIVEAVRKRGSHKKLVIFGLVLVGMIAAGAAIVDGGTI
jgi:hypothetical protein